MLSDCVIGLGQACVIDLIAVIYTVFHCLLHNIFIFVPRNPCKNRYFLVQLIKYMSHLGHVVFSF